MGGHMFIHMKHENRFLNNGSKIILNDIVDNGAFPHGNIKKGTSLACPHEV
jgi:hypothetical protein